MNKELANLQDLKNAFISHCKTLGYEDAYIKVCENKFDIIEAELKKWEEHQNTCQELYYEEMCKKQEKVLKIIVKKDVKIELVRQLPDYRTYNQWLNKISLDYDLTEEEFNLIKEALKEYEK